jgi:hypothetical protein
VFCVSRVKTRPMFWVGFSCREVCLVLPSVFFQLTRERCPSNAESIKPLITNKFLNVEHILLLLTSSKEASSVWVTCSWVGLKWKAFLWEYKIRLIPQDLACSPVTSHSSLYAVMLYLLPCISKSNIALI